jgi:hypothetical protein
MQDVRNLRKNDIKRNSDIQAGEIMRRRRHDFINTYTFGIPALIIGFLIMLPLAPSAQENNTWPPPAPALDQGALTGDELALIDLGLSSINMTWSDMGFRKDYVDDPFRLEIAQRALDEPYFLVLWNYEWDDFLLTPKTPAQILMRAATDLDSDLHNTVPLSPSAASVDVRARSRCFPQDGRSR